MTNTYQQILREFKDKISAHTSDYIPRMYKALINEGRSPGDARQKLEEDLLDLVSERTLLRNLPDEAKDKEQVERASHPHKAADMVSAEPEIVRVLLTSCQ